MQRELNTLEERVLELISLNESLRKVNKDLVSQLNKKLDECEVLQKKVNLSKTSLIRIQKLNAAFKFAIAWIPAVASDSFCGGAVGADVASERG